MTFVENLDRALIPKLVGMHDAWNQYRAELDRERLIRLLVETYHYIRHSVPLMELAQEKCADAKPEMAHYFDHHIEEEQDHDVWLLEDLEEIGLPAEQVRNGRPLRPTLGMVATQYYLIERVNPMGLLGYMYVLEGLTPRPESVKDYARQVGLPEKAMRTILEHCELDPHHIEDMREALQSSELDDEDRDLIVFNAKGTIAYLTEMYREMRSAAVAESLEQEREKIPA